MKVDKYLIRLLTLLVVMVLAIPAGATEYPSNGQIAWKGVTWDVRSWGGEPGPNVWNPNGVYIDDKNRLHLTIVKDKGVWRCSEVDSPTKYQYGTFTWTVASPVFTYDKNSVVGLFTYLDDSQELDIEMSRWEDADGENLWYSVQPYSVSGNNKGTLMSSTGVNTVHTIDWQPNYIRFTSKTASGKTLYDFNYTNVKGIPKNSQYVMMNLWMINGKAPSNGKNIDLAISDFEYTPSTQKEDTTTIKKKYRKYR